MARLLRLLPLLYKADDANHPFAVLARKPLLLKKSAVEQFLDVAGRIFNVWNIKPAFAVRPAIWANDPQPEGGP